MQTDVAQLNKSCVTCMGEQMGRVTRTVSRVTFRLCYQVTEGLLTGYFALLAKWRTVVP